MKNVTQVLLAGLLMLLAGSAHGQKILNLASSYDAGSFDEGAAEIVTYDVASKRLFLTNAEAGTIDVLDIIIPTLPRLVNQISIDTLGEGVNSVSAANGVIAAAIEGPDQMPGVVALFDADGTLIKTYPTGALPDMVTFSPNGNYVLVACEGEPDDDYLVDPEGSITVVDITGGADNGVVTQIPFTQFNDQKASLMNAGIRIFGPNATVAQDLEPEYITADPNNDSLAYVMLQENNAFAVIDYRNGAIIDLLPLGFKDHSMGAPSIEQYRLDQLPSLPELGTPVYNGGQPTVMLGGFSGMYYDPTESTADSYVFYAVPDRGPNESTVNRNTLTLPTAKNLRPFKLPEYQGRIVKFTLDVTNNTVTLDSADQIFLTHPDGTTPIRGFGNIPTVDEVPVTYTDIATAYADSSFFDGTTYYHQLPYDPYGGDFEGILKDGAGNFWMVDEYRPAIYQFNPAGVMQERLIPQPLVEDIFFSEYGEGSSNNKYLEIYNGTADTVDLSNYLLVNCNNGCDVQGEWDFSNATDSIFGKKIAPGDVFVIVHPSARKELLDFGDTRFQFLSNGDDWYGLVRASDSTIVDQIGLFDTVDPGDGWDVAGVTAATKDHTLIRKSFITSGNSNWLVGAAGDSINSEWIVDIRPDADTILPTIGAHEVTFAAFGNPTLPAVYNNRRANRGFEAMALDTDSAILYAFIQSPMDNPNTSVRTNDILRILGVNPGTGQPVAEYVYVLEANARPRFWTSRVDKIGDAVYVGGGKFKVLERDSSTPDQPTGKKYIFEIDLKGATNILGTELSNRTSGATLESMSADDLAAMGIVPVHKRKILNLPSIGYLASDKPEGLVQINDTTIGVLNDNDFGLAGAGVSDASTLGIITFNKNFSFDASNEDGVINFQNWPTLGMYQADAIKAYSIDGETYVFTANEGDGREYEGTPGYTDEARVADFLLDVGVFGDTAMLSAEESLGRVKVTNSLGDLDGDGDYDQLYTYGARSFGIWDKYGNLIYDSGDEFARTVASQYPDQFNATNDDNDSFDNRSDDKGIEPEAVEVAAIDNKIYAFIGLERMGGIMVYDVTDPKAPVFVEYELNRDFSFDADTSLAGDLGPEDIIFISGDESPVQGLPLVVVANEVSGTVSIYSINKNIVSNDQNLDVVRNPLRVYPNPVNGETLFFSKTGTYTVFNMVGQSVARVSNTKSLNISNLQAGVYFVRSEKNETARFIRK